VSDFDQQELVNALDQARREIATRYDFKGTSASIDRAESVITIRGDSDFQLAQIADILYQKLTKRGIDVRAVDAVKPESAGGDKRKQALTLKQGIGAELARRLVKRVKESGLKVQVATQENQLRVTGKKRDDLQAVIALLRAEQLDQPLQYTNFRDG
jgi:uncharacterized protein YajQ (UPF0234 family)